MKFPAPYTDSEKAAYDGLVSASRLIAITNKKWMVNPRTGKRIKRNFGEMIALAHSELSEALEHHRKRTMDDKLTHRDGVEVELADAVTRILHTAWECGYDLPAALIEKNRFNRVRKDHKLAARRKKNGKRY